MKKGKEMKVLKRILIGILLLIFTVFLCYFVFHLDTVKVEGTEYYSEEEIRQAVFTRDFSDNEIIFFIYSKIYGINTLPFVEEIEAEYHNPRSMTLHVYDKTISGCIQYMGQYVYFDKDGIVLQTLPEQIEGVPVVVGINFGNFTVGKPFDVKDDSVFDSLMNVSQQIGHYGMHIDKIKITDGAIRLISGSLRIDLGKKDRYDNEMAELAGVMEEAAKQNLKLKGTIDLENYKEGDNIIVKPAEKSAEKSSSKKKKNAAGASAKPNATAEPGATTEPDVSAEPEETKTPNTGEETDPPLEW